jgi:hypothetical protein
MPTVRVVSFDVGTRNLAYFVGTVDTETLEFTTEHWGCDDVFAITGTDVSSAPSIAECCRAMSMYMEHHFPGRLRRPDLLLIEKQPSGCGFGRGNATMNLKMKVLSHVIQVSLERQYNGDATRPPLVAEFVDPKLKLKLIPEAFFERTARAQAARRRKPKSKTPTPSLAAFLQQPTAPDVVDTAAAAPPAPDKAAAKKKQKYKLNKGVSVAYTQSLTAIPAGKGQKKDDFADCLLQALAWLWKLREALRAELRKALAQQQKKEAREAKAREKAQAAADRRAAKAAAREKPDVKRVKL